MGYCDTRSEPAVPVLHIAQIQQGPTQTSRNKQSNISRLLRARHLQRGDFGDSMRRVNDCERHGDCRRQNGQGPLGDCQIFFTGNWDERCYIRISFW